MASVHGHHQVGRFGLGRQTGRRTAALDVDDDQRQFEADGEADGLRLERHAGTTRRGDPQMAAVGRTQRRADRCDLVLGLEGRHAELLVPGQFVEDV